MHMVAGALVLQRPANQLVLLLRAQEQAIYDPLIPSMHVHLFSHRAVYPSPNLCLPISLPTRLTTGIGQLALARHLQAARAAASCDRPQCATSVRPHAPHAVPATVHQVSPESPISPLRHLPHLPSPTTSPAPAPTKQVLGVARRRLVGCRRAAPRHRLPWRSRVTPRVREDYPPPRSARHRPHRRHHLACLPHSPLRCCGASAAYASAACATSSRHCLPALPSRQVAHRPRGPRRRPQRRQRRGAQAAAVLTPAVRHGGDVMATAGRLRGHGGDRVVEHAARRRRAAAALRRRWRACMVG